ncbi:PepSY domain-containing protein [Yoonia sp.]|uniref:PepSY domain-containing protein n=1 Tax=Yoonia sp. TaxID=2212373 RepID=UPI003F6D08F3
MKNILLSTTAAIAMTATAAFSQSIADQVITQLQEQGYTRIEVENGPTQVKVEAIRDGMKLEVVYDAATGAILKEEVAPIDADDDVRSGVSVRDDDEDFIDDEDDEDDEDVDDDDEDDDDDNDSDENDDDEGDDD